jgi:hypothetical protein
MLAALFVEAQIAEERSDEGPKIPARAATRDVQSRWHGPVFRDGP